MYFPRGSGRRLGRTAYFILLRAFCDRMDLRRSSRFFLFRADFAGVLNPNKSMAGTAFTGLASLMVFSCSGSRLYRDGKVKSDS